jgi:hypothetical protein
MKKIASIVFIAMFALSTMTANAQLITPSDEPFEVTPVSSIAPVSSYSMGYYMDYDEALNWAFENDVMTGYEDGYLGEKECVKRVEILKMLFKVLEIDETQSTAELFPDTPEGEWYIDFVETGRHRNTIQGYEDGMFRPAQCVNRAEAIKMAILEFNDGEVPEYITNYTSDDITSDQWFYNHAMYALSQDAVGLNHIIYTYYPNFNYYPGESMTREEVAEMLYRLKTMKDRGLEMYMDSYEPDDLIVVPLESYNIELEEFLSDDTGMLVSIDTNDSIQTSKFNNLLSLFPAEDLDGLVEEFFEDMSENFAELGLSYDSEVQPVFGDKYRAVLGVSGSMLSGSDMHFAITVADSAKLENFINTLAGHPDYREANILGFRTLTNESDLVYLAFTDNAILLSKTKGDRYEALQRLKNGEPTLMDNADYTGYLGTLPTPNLGIMYLNFDSLSGAEMSGLGAPLGSAVVSEAIAFIAESDGLNLHVQIAGHETPNYEPYMYKKIPGKDLIMYGEAYGLVDMSEVTGTNPLEELEVEGIMFTEGEWMNAGYAFVIQHNNAMIPGISMYFDASKDVTGGQAALDSFDEFMNEMFGDTSSMPPEFTAVFVKDTLYIDGRKFNRLMIDATELTEEERYELDLEGSFYDTPFYFYYGMSADNYVVFSTYNDFPQELGSYSTVSRDSTVQESMKYIEGYPYGYSFISVPETMVYIDELIALFEVDEGPMPDDMREVYDKIKEYLNPIEYMVSGNAEYVDMAKGLLFLKIGN